VESTEPARKASSLSMGWLAVSAITAAVAVSWLPLLTGRFGDNHLGRVEGRYALQLRNLQEKGLLDSTFGADWSPYSSTPYAHHPPLPNLLSWLFGALPGDAEWQVRLGPYLLALLALPAAAALLRNLGIRWSATLVAVGLMAVTGYYWVYGVLMFDIGTVLALLAAAVHVRREPTPSRRAIWLACGAAVLATLGSWPGIGFAAGLGLWLLITRRFDRVAILLCASMAVGLAVSLAYMFGVHGLGALKDQTELRTAGGSYTAWEFVRQQARWFTALLPVWYLVLLPIGVVAGLIDRRTRFVTALASVCAGGWVLVLNEGAYVHEYWAFLVLVPGVIGMGALLDRIAGLLPSRALGAGALAVGVGLTVAFGVMVVGHTAQRYFYNPEKAGELVAEHGPAAGQQYAWHDGRPVPRWLCYYWDLPAREMNAQALAEAKPDDLILVFTSRRPGWLPTSVRPVAQDGPYGLFRAGDVQDAAAHP
jgi:hypothetical protein